MTKSFKQQIFFLSCAYSTWALRLAISRLAPLSFNSLDEPEWAATKNETQPCVGHCREVSKDGIMFLGSSEIRRLYVRVLANLEGLTNLESEMLQDNAKVWAHEMGNAPLDRYRGENGEPFFDYNKTGARLRFRWDASFNFENVHTEIIDAYNSGTKYFYYGLPTPHMLYDIGWQNEACHTGNRFPEYVTEHLNKLANRLKESFPSSSDRPHIVVGNGIMFANRHHSRECVQSPVGATCDATVCGKSCELEGNENCKVQQCELGACNYMQDDNGLNVFNRILSEAFKKLSKPPFRLFDMQNATASTKHFNESGWSDRNVHYKYPVLDSQLTGIFETLLQS